MQRWHIRTKNHIEIWINSIKEWKRRMGPMPNPPDYIPPPKRVAYRALEVISMNL
jgi:hypothetical protein